jgi:hypothetical protein
MDYSVLGLFAVMVLASVIATRYQSRAWRGRPGYRYQRVITIGVVGLWLTIAGTIGWDLRHVRGFFQGTRWVDGPIWWQIGTGIALLACAMFMGRRVPPDATRSRGVR